MSFIKGAIIFLIIGHVFMAIMESWCDKRDLDNMSR